MPHSTLMWDFIYGGIESFFRIITGTNRGLRVLHLVYLYPEVCIPLKLVYFSDLNQEQPNQWGGIFLFFFFKTLAWWRQGCAMFVCRNPQIYWLGRFRSLSLSAFWWYHFSSTSSSYLLHKHWHRWGPLHPGGDSILSAQVSHKH